MTMSPGVEVRDELRRASRSTTAAGTISQIARGSCELRDELLERRGAGRAIAHRAPRPRPAARRRRRTRGRAPTRRRTMLAPIRPRPIIPSCMGSRFLVCAHRACAVAAGAVRRRRRHGSRHRRPWRSSRRQRLCRRAWSTRPRATSTARQPISIDRCVRKRYCISKPGQSFGRSGRRRSRFPRRSSAEQRLEQRAGSIQPAEPVYQVQPPRPACGGKAYTSAATTYGSTL